MVRTRKWHTPIGSLDEHAGLRRVGTCLALNNVPSACVISRTNVLETDVNKGVGREMWRRVIKVTEA